MSEFGSKIMLDWQTKCSYLAPIKNICQVHCQHTYALLTVDTSLVNIIYSFDCRLYSVILSILFGVSNCFNDLDKSDIKTLS